MTGYSNAQHEGEPIELVTHRDDIYRMLSTIEKKRSVISLRFVDNNKKFYSSMILKVDYNESYFIIDAVNHTEINHRMGMAEPFDIIASDGLPVVLNQNVATRSSDAQWPDAYRIRFPESIDYRQRRQAFRAPVVHPSLSNVTLVDITTQEQYQGTLSDLSATGVGAIFDHQGPSHDGQIFANCCIQLASGMGLTCAVIAKHPQFDSAISAYRTGLEFVGLDSLQQKKIDRCVLDLQRQAKHFDAKSSNVRRVGSHS